MNRYIKQITQDVMKTGHLAICLELPFETDALPISVLPSGACTTAVHAPEKVELTTICSSRLCQQSTHL